jgi:WD40 repeat protein
MSKIFISHSSSDNATALAMGQWLAENGWDDFFLDIEPARGLSPGERWREALKTAADRCEAVLCLLSPAWLDSTWCRDELYLAHQLGKIILGVFIEPTRQEDLPRELATDWQVCDLVEGATRRVFQVGLDPIVSATEVSLAAPGLERLKLGLRRAGLDASTFPWPPPGDPERAPYRGFRALAAEDAAVFFGREAEVVRGLDALRRLRERDVERMLILLGASGAGKSSFLRAGLWPRLGRDDRRFLPLPVIRPEKAVLSGLAASLEAAFRGLRQARSRADLRSVLAEPGGFDRLIAELQSLAGHRLGADASPPTVVLGIDQAEELLGSEGRQEAETFLSLLAQALAAAPRRVMTMLAIRSDSFERLQAEPLLAGSRWALFDLRPMARAEYKAVVEGPAARATAAGRPLRIDPELTERLLAEAEGADALPLLAFTLERLFVEHGGDGSLSLPEYEALGGLRGSIEEVVKAAFAEPGREPAIPADEAERMRRLKEGFIPWLARIDPDTEERKRRVARLEEITAESRPLIERLITARLLLSDRRRIEGHNGEVVVVEVAHEALLRQWPTLTAWLDMDAADLRDLEATRRAAGEWKRNDGRADWLAHTGDRLRAAEALRRRPDFARLLGEEGRAYLEACRRRDDQVQKDREAQARRVARAQRLTWALLALIAVVLVGAGLGIIGKTRELGKQTALVLASAAQAANDAGYHDRALRIALLAARGDWLSPVIPEAEVQIARAAHASALIAQTRHWGRVSSALFSPDGRRVVSADEYGTVRVWDAATGMTLSETGHPSGVLAAAFTPNGLIVVSGSQDGTVRVWDAMTGKTLSEIRYDQLLRSISFSPNARRVVGAFSGGAVQVRDVATGNILATLKSAPLGVVMSFSPDGNRVISTGWDETARVWDATTGRVLAQWKHDGFVKAASFSSDGQRVVSATRDGKIYVRDVAMGKQLAEWRQQDLVESVSFGPGDYQVVIGSKNGTLRWWDVISGQIVAEVKHEGAVRSVSFSLDGRWLVSASDDGTARVWDLSSQKPLLGATLHPQVLAASFSSDGRRVVSGSADGSVRVSDVLTGRILAEVKEGFPVSSVAFSPDGRWVVSACGSGITIVWDASLRSPVFGPKHKARVRTTSFSSDSRRVVSASVDGTLYVWDAASGKLIDGRKVLGTPETKYRLISAAFSPDGQRVVSTSAEGVVRVWNVPAGSSLPTRSRDLLLSRIPPTDKLISAAFTSDGRRVVSISNRGTLRGWDAKTGESLFEVKVGVPMLSASFSSDGRRVVSESGDGCFLWDAATGLLLAKMSGSSFRFEREMSIPSFSLDGRRVLSASMSDTVRVWDTRWLALGREELVDTVCREKLKGAKILTAEDVQATILLRGREGEDVCAPVTPAQ